MSAQTSNAAFFKQLSRYYTFYTGGFIAFVIGNDGYENAQLPTAANDAALVADALAPDNEPFGVVGNIWR